MREIMMRLVKEEDGQGMAEYGLILALIAVVVIVTLGPLGDRIAELFTEVTEGFDHTPEQ